MAVNNLKTSANGLAIIKESEGFSATAYKCPAGIWTIGYGHVILPHESFTEITEQQGEYLLIKDVRIAEDCINSNALVVLAQNQFDALVSLVFNIGCAAFKASTLLKILNSGD
jgi:lysozyme